MIRHLYSNIASIGTVAMAVSLAVLALAAPAQAKKITTKWESTSTYSPSTGQSDLEYTYSCPAGYTAISGGYEFNSAGQVDDIALTANGPRFDENPVDYNVWAFHFHWPNGAAAGEQITFNVVCQS